MMTVGEIMNREVFSLREDDAAEDSLHYLAALDIDSAPVLDSEQRPVGMVAWSDLVGAPKGELVGDLMRSELVTIGENAHIRAAARLLAASGEHCVLAVDPFGRVVGVAAGIDIVRGLIGMPVAHPAAFPHLDSVTGLSWSDPRRLRTMAIEQVPAAPGIFELLLDTAHLPARTVWYEATGDLRARLDALARGEGDFPASISRWHGWGEVEYRFAREPDPVARERLVNQLWDQLDGRSVPVTTGGHPLDAEDQPLDPHTH